MSEQEEGFRPLRSRTRINAGSDDPVIGRATLDNSREIDRANFSHTRHNALGQRRLVIRIEFVHIEPLRFPIFVQTKAETESRLLFQPTDMGFYFLDRR